MIRELPPDINRDVAEFDCGNMGRLVVTAQHAMSLGIPAREIAELYVEMIAQGCPVDTAKAWAEAVSQ